MAPAGWTAQTNDPAPQRRDGAAATPPRAKNRAALAPNPSAPYLASGSTDVRSAALRTSLEEVAGTCPQPALTPALPLAAPPPAPRTHARTHARTPARHFRGVGANRKDAGFRRNPPWVERA